MIADSPCFVFDSFALLAFLQEEPAADAVEGLLKRGRLGEVRLVMTVVNLGEVFYRTVREHGIGGGDRALARIQQFPIELVEIDQKLALAAATLKADSGLGYADCFVAALAQQLHATVVTGDPDFQKIEDLIAMEWLPSAQSP